ncbi:GDP-mannose 4,6-dehydratase [Frigoribacterium sp. MCBA15_019]|uniref:GDP-mannose 4,6-dehydratase n=1 Tax=unclassified Frigoribacterium TaxID=2627005 RepID=UPI0008DD10EC|nr:GDP-mannose 4,6-dehydratase [Frigoribacterium sp. MCBA15_019]OII27742.1 GDP-mannose 4,6 dehydratase [Frigoribacterium sp. MCBA15_019]
MLRALVTGVAGQTGSYLAENLVARGLEVHGVVRDGGDDGPPADLPPEVILHRGDLTDLPGMRSTVLDVRPDVVVNLAALSSVAASWRLPVDTAVLNGAAVAGLLAAVAELRDGGHDAAFVQASSAEIFGQAAVSPQNETTPVAPVNPYGASKAYAHLLVGAYRAAGMRASSVVLYNHESPRRPEQFVTRKITAAAARIARGEQSELVLGDLTVRRDWGWAPDYAEALALVATSDTAEDYVVATGESHSIQDFVDAAFARVGITHTTGLVRSDAEFVRPTDAAELRGDSTKIRAALGWSPTRSFTDVVDAMVDADL